MLISHRIALAPNNKQQTYFAKASGVARFTYNWALAEWKRQYEASLRDATAPPPSERELRKQLNRIKRQQFPWMLEVSKSAPQMAIIQLGKAFTNFFAGRANYPQFRKKGDYERFTLINETVQVQGSHIRIPLLGWVRMREALRFEGRLIAVAISRVSDRWYASLTVDLSGAVPEHENQIAVGVDVGISALATLSTGERITACQPHRSLISRVRRLSKAISRKQKGSSNRRKAGSRLARLHVRIANIRREELHQATNQITRRYGIIGIESLNVKGMLANRCLSRAIADAGFYEFRRQIQYKAKLRGNRLVLADRWFPSSKICSGCGTKREVLHLKTRTWACADCGVSHDRDLNAARNLESLAASSAASVCGKESSGHGSKTGTKLALAKQKSSIRAA